MALRPPTEGLMVTRDRTSTFYTSTTRPRYVILVRGVSHATMFATEFLTKSTTSFTRISVYFAHRSVNYWTTLWQRTADAQLHGELPGPATACRLPGSVAAETSEEAADIAAQWKSLPTAIRSQFVEKSVEGTRCGQLCRSAAPSGAGSCGGGGGSRDLRGNRVRFADRTAGAALLTRSIQLGSVGEQSFII